MTTRIYQAIPLAAHTLIQLDEAASHHLARVLRASIGDELHIFNGNDLEHLGVIEAITKKTVTVALQQPLQRPSTESPLEIWLAQGISRGEKMDYTIQKAVELGVKKIIPLFTERCNIKLDEERSSKRVQHWQSVAISACEQSGRQCVPEVTAPQTITNFLQKTVADYGFILSPYAKQKLKGYPISRTARITLVIGPEGGLSEQELCLAEQHHFLPLNLGPRVLRTETAALAAITALQCYFGDF